MRVILWGTYDIGKPRTRLLRSALASAGVEVIEVRSPVWDGVEDKAQIAGLIPKISYALRWLLAYPGLIVRYLRAPAHDVVIVAYMGHLDVLVLWAFARLRGKPIVWDAFLSLYDTVVSDRQLVGPKNLLAWALWAFEWLACRGSNCVVLDTQAHADLFCELYGLKASRVASVFVGAEYEHFDRDIPVSPGRRDPGESEDLKVLFYGQFIPLHGIETIVRAAQLAQDRPIRWTLIGRGQEESRIRELIDAGPKAKLDWVSWVPYEELAGWISSADICLGIFGGTGKAARVIPNKVFQILAAGKPLVTRDSLAIRELLNGSMPGVYLVPAANPRALLEAIETFASERQGLAEVSLHAEVKQKFALPALGEKWLKIVQTTR